MGIPGRLTLVRWLPLVGFHDALGQRVHRHLPSGEPLDDERFAYSLVFGKQLTDRWRYVFQHDYGAQANRQLIVSGRSTSFVKF